MAITVEKKKSEPSKTLGPIIVDLGKRRRKDIKQLSREPESLLMKFRSACRNWLPPGLFRQMRNPSF
jgi:hypothetical protein